MAHRQSKGLSTRTAPVSGQRVGRRSFMVLRWSIASQSGADCRPLLPGLLRTSLFFSWIRLDWLPPPPEITPSSGAVSLPAPLDSLGPGDVNAMRDRIHCPAGEIHASAARIHCPPSEIHAFAPRVNASGLRVNVFAGRMNVFALRVNMFRRHMNAFPERARAAARRSVARRRCVNCSGRRRRSAGKLRRLDVEPGEGGGKPGMAAESSRAWLLAMPSSSLARTPLMVVCPARRGT